MLSYYLEYTFFPLSKSDAGWGGFVRGNLESIKVDGKTYFKVKDLKTVREIYKGKLSKRTLRNTGDKEIVLIGWA